MVRIVIIGFLTVFSWPIIAQNTVKIRNFSLTDVVNGQTVNFQNFSQEKGVVIIFTSAYCPYSKLYENRIKTLNKQYADRGIQVLLVNSNDPSVSPKDAISKMKEWAQNYAYTFPYLSDKNQELKELLAAQKTPEAFLLKPQSYGFQVVYNGAIDDNPQSEVEVRQRYLKNAIEKLLKDEPIKKNTIRPTGCVIKT